MGEPKTPNTVFRELREREWRSSRTEAARMIRKKAAELGEPVECDARTISLWEDGTTACPRPIYQRVLYAMTGRNPEQLGFAPPRRGRRPATESAEEDGTPDMRRRSLLIAAGAGLLTDAGPAGNEGDRQLGDAHVQAILDTEQRLYAQDRQFGAVELNQLAATAVARANRWLRNGRYSEQVGRRLQLATGALSVTAGWLALDSGRTTDARSLYTEALVCARHADDPGLEAHAFGCLSLLATSTDHPREAVSTARVAQRAAAQLGSPRWLSLLAMREARGWALQGDRTLTEQALVRAYHLYGQGPRDADPAWLEFFVPAELTGLESLCRADLGQYERACAGAEQTVMLFAADHTRNRALYTADIALHHARKPRPDLDAAVDAAHRALRYLPGVHSDRLTRALDAVAGVLTPHEQVRSVAGYFDIYRAARAPQ
ncbi:hypothetical protein [Micromonospora sp. NPDC049662]|uniref:hypothetical protein n=1 Tax=Micromonospora sp. NPDC049662 TaxID=3155397 RepID=UPI00342CCD3C